MTLAIIVGVIVGLVTYVCLFNTLFPYKGDFLEAIRYWLQPQVVSHLRGEYDKDITISFKFVVWLVSGTLIGFAAATIVFQVIG